MALKASAASVGDVVASQTAIATGEVDILVGGGEWVTAGLVVREPEPRLDRSPNRAPCAGRSRSASLRDRTKPDLALEFVNTCAVARRAGGAGDIVLLLGDAGQRGGGRCADGRAEGGPALGRAGRLPGARAALPGPGCRAGCRDAGRLDRILRAVTDASHRTASNAGGRWALLAPAALLDGGCSSRCPSGVMAAVLSLRRGEVARLDRRATTPSSSATRTYVGALCNSLEITLIVTVMSVLLAYPLACDHRRAGARAVAAAGAGAGGAAVLDLLCRAVLRLAAGAGQERGGEQGAGRRWGCAALALAATRASPR